MKTEVKISVRTLVEYAFRSGSISSSFTSAVRMSEGTRLHQKVQAAYGDEDEKEKYLSAIVNHGDYTFALEGRCDGLLLTDNGMVIDEIKTTLRDLSELEEDSYPVHWAQAMVYAYMYALQEEEEQITVQLTYVHAVTEEHKRFLRICTLPELKAFVENVLTIYTPFAELREHHTKKRTETIKQLSFPFSSYRANQREFAGAVYQSIAHNRNLFAQAPTGTGKTISTLFPAIKSIGEGLAQRILYVTAKTITRTAAEETTALLKKAGLHAYTVTLTAKEKMCFKEQFHCESGACPFQEGYYDRINEAVLDILRNETLMTRDVIQKYARKHTVCPFEYSLDLAYLADIIICDYNYVFDPRISLKRFLEEHKKNSILLVDEAHNLPDRARGMFSATLEKSSFLQLQREWKGKNREVHEAAKALNSFLLKIRKELEPEKEGVKEEVPEELLMLAEQFISAAEKQLLQGAEDSALLLDTFFQTGNFLRISGLYDERFLTLFHCERSEVVVTLLCLDPSHLLQKQGRGYKAKIYFSATLMPLDYFQEILGAGEEYDSKSIPSPFQRENLKIHIKPLSTRYKDRETTKQQILETIRNTSLEQEGNILVFFPSYQYMDNLYESFTEIYPEVKTIAQNRIMQESEREDFLKLFQQQEKSQLIGFAVMGGIFSEGIDLRGDALQGVIVVGVGLPQLSLERNLMKNYYNSIGKSGYDYAYTFPGMNKVLQAGGRLIRTEEDKGTIVLIDDRFLYSKYQSLFPYEWRHFTVI
ncbi:DEAD/DEAH box helicase [Bacillus lacus]|uniref:DNA 5'-3' helicase n=1 Tax=Metabacillus lacus TaxID=1983721 RepID=A0A7X2J0E6_9BACI|nr:ATP-dependent DNA helicase [Metabacillus lacus]MRX72448.1 DEAD/DEAH box helicase [Metabacillus lacus]